MPACLGEIRPDGQPGRVLGRPQLPPQFFFLTLVVILGGVRGPRHCPAWRSAERACVAAVFQREASLTVLAAPLATAGLLPFIFHSHMVHAAMEDCEAPRPGPRGGRLWEALRTTSCQGTFFKYQVHSLTVSFLKFVSYIIMYKNLLQRIFPFQYCVK